MIIPCFEMNITMAYDFVRGEKKYSHSSSLVLYKALLSAFMKSDSRFASCSDEYLTEHYPLALMLRLQQSIGPNLHPLQREVINIFFNLLFLVYLTLVLFSSNNLSFQYDLEEVFKSH